VWVLEELVGKVTLIYGVAGSGKTNLCFWTLSRGPGTGLYISTEGPVPLDLLSRYGLVWRDRLFVKEVFSVEDLTVELLEMYVNSSLSRFRGICIDSVNAHYRYEATWRADAGRLLNTALAILSQVASSRGSYVILTAQVREEEGEEVPSGYEILEFWSDTVVKITKSGSKRIIEWLKPSSLKGRKAVFTISDRGLEFEL
jgi:RecA/RadA recombinase